MKNLAIIGATGAVGKEMLQLLEKRQFPLNQLRCFASENSVGKEITFCGKNIVIEAVTNKSFNGIDIALLSAGSALSKKIAPLWAEAGVICIDNSSGFRNDPRVPLVIPEINSHALKNHPRIIASPNCTTTIMLMALYPLHQKFGIKRIVASTYQAASGAGARAMEELLGETKAHLEDQPYERKVVPFPYAFNLFSHNSPLTDNGYVEEEMKMLHETRKILEDDSIQVTATCIRVPVLRAHSISLNVEFHSRITQEDVYEILQKSAGVTLFEDRSKNRFAMPLDATGEDNILCGRIREDYTQPNTIEMWVVGDQLLKGAALNAIQIAEALCK